MSEKQKISHFSIELDDKNSHFNQITDRSELSKLYLKPKTSEELNQDNENRTKAIRKRFTKHPRIITTLYGTMVYGAIVVFIQNLRGTWWSNGDSAGLTMGTVFFTFAIALGLSYLLYVWITNTNKLLSFFGNNNKTFWTVYVIGILLLTVFWLNGMILDYTNIIWLPILVLSNLLVTFVVSINTIKKF